MPPWEQIEDREVSVYIDEAMFFMVVMGGMEPFGAWRKLEHLQPRSPPGTIGYDLFFHELSYDLAMFLVHGEGATAYQLLVGKTPFRPDKKSDALAALASNERPNVRHARADVPDALARVVEGLLALDANERPTIPQAREALESVPGMVTGGRSLKQTIQNLVPDAAPSTTHQAFKLQGYERSKTEPKAIHAVKAVPQPNDAITRVGKVTPQQSENVSSTPRANPNAANEHRSGSTVPSPAPAHSEWPTRH
jgi:serine/threonine protein kinase